MKKSAKLANLIQRYLRQLRQGLEVTSNPAKKHEDPLDELAIGDPPVMFDAWDNVHAGSECWSCHDPSSMARRVGLIR